MFLCPSLIVNGVVIPFAEEVKTVTLTDPLALSTEIIVRKYKAEILSISFFKVNRLSSGTRLKAITMQIAMDCLLIWCINAQRHVGSFL